MNPNTKQLGKIIRDAILRVAPTVGRKRPSTKAIYEALKAVRPALLSEFGGPVKCRYAGCPPVANRDCPRPFKVLEYLWDFSFSRFDIPSAIEQCGHVPHGSKYELLFVAESELGTAHEICRDLLKLLEARTSIRCLVYRQPKRLKERREFEARMVRVLHNHAYFERSPGIWLFIGLTWADQTIECDVYTLNDRLNEIVPVQLA